MKQHVLETFLCQFFCIHIFVHNTFILQRIESARKEKEEYEKQLEEERQAAIARDRKKMEQKVEEEKKFAEMLKQQMLELKARETEVSFFSQ